MTDSSRISDVGGAFEDETQPHHPKHRLEGVAVDSPAVNDSPLLEQFGDNPDTAAAG